MLYRLIHVVTVDFLALYKHHYLTEDNFESAMLWCASNNSCVTVSFEYH